MLIFVLLLLASSSLVAAEYPRAILPGDFPDPTIIRDGEEFYMTHSPFVYSPGFLIWRSTDLANWEPLARTHTEIRGSAYAPDLVKHDGRYYIYYPASGSNWVIWADDIRGPWSPPIDLKTQRIDPGHVVAQDGKRFLHLSAGTMIPLADDGLSTEGELTTVYKGWRYPREWKTEGFYLESPKLNYKDGYYYLTSAQGGTAGPPTSHMVVSARSKNVDGPWENSPYNPIVRTHSAEEPWWSKGHGTLVCDTHNDWWIVYHGYKRAAHTLGRHTLIDPIKWTDDGWFTLDEDRPPLPASPKVSPVDPSDDFSADKLGLLWSFWGRYPRNAIELKEGSLFLRGRGESPANGRKMLVTIPDHHYEVQVEVDLGEAGAGGLILYYRESVFAGVTADESSLTVHKDATESETFENKLGKNFFLKIINQEDLCTLQVSKDGGEWETLVDHLDVSGMHHNNHRSFYALRAGLVATGSGTTRFDNFRYQSGALAPKPLFRDPVYDGAADPCIVWNPIVKKWWMFYTNRRSTETELPGVSWVFKTKIGIAESEDGAHWSYVGTANIPRLPEELGGGNATLWAPDIVRGDDGAWRLFLSIQAGVAESWGKVPGYIVQLSSDDLRNWKVDHTFDLPVGSYDAEAIRTPQGAWRLYYKDPSNHASTFYFLESDDLRRWSEPQRVLSTQGEGPAMFHWKGADWMILCDGRGFKTFRSDDGIDWIQQPGGPLMPHGSGVGTDDTTTARHGDVIVSKNRAYLYYFTHPGRVGEDATKDGYEQRRSSIQVVELKLRDDRIVAERNDPTYVDLEPR
ncbi:Beta-xylosidase [Pseudobythopirellula maris]|uniref:Beta-xylosidase n=1 Tax=Pseudobythopirellula maris TaxID=2527991 RepID=A0A5C5ZI97_9BACT|nr:family 43 glycosylhydrolase [Pseudobythopirellula maris]TWT87129.1 Beta-xylosidase [Pseudobythopirellula maris]